MGIHFSLVLGIVRISASREICKKSLTLGYLCFPAIFCTMEAHFFHVTDIVWMQNYKIFLSFLELFKVIFSIHRDMRG